MPEETLWTNPGEGVPFERIRHPLRTRSLSVHAIADVTPQMRRITFAGDDLADFASPGFDDHIKIMFPVAAGDPVRRDYAPRGHDRNAGLLTVDFALHESGPASDWALQARLGDLLDIAGPKGSAILSPQVRSWLLVGDETALPAIGRRIEEASRGTRITSVVVVTGTGEEQVFVTDADLASIWAHRPKARAADSAALIAAVRMVDCGRRHTYGSPPKPALPVPSGIILPTDRAILATGSRPPDTGLPGAPMLTNGSHESGPERGLGDAIAQAICGTHSTGAATQMLCPEHDFLLSARPLTKREAARTNAERQFREITPVLCHAKEGCSQRQS